MQRNDGDTRHDRDATLVDDDHAAPHRGDLEEAILPSHSAAAAATANANDSPGLDASSDKQLGNDGSQEDMDAASAVKGPHRRSHRWDVVRSQYKQPPDELEDDHTQLQYMPAWLYRIFSAILALPVIRTICRFLSGPADISARRQPRLWRMPVLDAFIEPYLVRYTRWARRPEYLYIFLLAWFLGFTFLARAAWYNSSAGDNAWIGGTTTYWGRNDACGLDGANCGPFEGYAANYRCPSRVATTQLLNYRT